MRRRFVLAVVCALVASVAGAAGLRASGRRADAAVRDSLFQMPPKHRAGWLRSRGLDDSYYVRYRVPESSGLRLVGKYGRGPAVEVTGQDSLVFVALGSEVAVVDVASPAAPQVLSEIQLGFRPAQVAVSGSLLVIGGNGVEVWSVATPGDPQFISRIPHAVADFCVRDSLVFLVSLDTFMVYSIANPASPQRLGAYPDSGYVTTCSGNTAVLVLPGLRGIGLVDVTDPTLPHRVGLYPCGAYSASARDGLCCVSLISPSQPAWLQLLVLDISNPASIIRLGSLDSAGGYDLCVRDSLLFASGYYTGGHEFQIISLGDSTSPTRIGGCTTPGDGWAVWVNRAAGRAYVADPDYGLAFLDVTSPSAPTLDTAILRADLAIDVALQGDIAYVADYTGGLKVLDVSSPASPVEVGHLDTVSSGFTVEAVAVKDSFVYASWWPQPKFRTFDVTDPTRPTLAGGVTTFDQPQAMVVRDTFAYAAQRLRLQVFNVARPRQPVLVGSCVIQGTGTDLTLVDSLAYVSSLPSPIINVSNPAAPTVIGTLPLCAYGIVVIDTFAIASDGGDSLIVYGVSNPAAPRWLSSVALSGAPQYTMDIELVGTMVYTTGSYVHVIDASDPATPRDLARWRPPYAGRRITWSAPYLYTACWDAGVCILETLPVGVSEQAEQARFWRPLRLHPNPAGREITVSVGNDGQHRGLWTIRDVAGRVIRTGAMAAGTEQVTIDLSAEPAGVYLVELEVNGIKHRGRIVKL